MDNRTTVVEFDTAEDVALAGAEIFVELAEKAIADHGFFSVALSGGSTPRSMYELLASNSLQELLASNSFQELVDWNRVHLFFGDERCVPVDSPESNYRMANEALISRVSIPTQNIHAIQGEGDPHESAKLYELELRSFFPKFPWPRFDLVLLGLGEDGHTASLFPYTDGLAEQHKWVVANWVEKLRAYRITLTPPSINAAANVTFMVVGLEKAAAVEAVILGPLDYNALPAQMIEPQSGTLAWLLDSGAGSDLNELEGTSAVHVTQQPENDNEDQDC